MTPSGSGPPAGVPRCCGMVCGAHNEARFGMVRGANLPNFHDATPCPFCKQSDSDLIGLKLHLMRGHCEVYEALQTPHPLAHYHTAKYVNGSLVDECARCGHDLRHPIHHRKGTK